MENEKYLIIGMHGIIPVNSTPISFEFAAGELVTAISKEHQNKRPIVCVNAINNEDGSAHSSKVGVMCKITNISRKGNMVTIATEAYKRVLVEEVKLTDNGVEFSSIDMVKEKREYDQESMALLENAKDLTSKYFSVNAQTDRVVFKSLLNIQEPNLFIDLLTSLVVKNNQTKIELLEEFDTVERLIILNNAIVNETEIIEIKKRVSEKVRKNMDKNQKDYFLREQMKVISEELGENYKELDELQSKVEKSPMPEGSKEKAKQEIARLKRLSNSSPEYSVIMNWLETVLDLPWGKKTKDNKDLNIAEKILDEDHSGLKDVKERILEHLAVMQLTDKIGGQIICFAGPPGVGKTSIAKSIARATGRNFVKMSLGGVKDESEIRGHRKTYIGAMPGRFIFNMRQAKSLNPVFLIDEIDKMASDYKGDPTSAMLEVLDPEQNSEFRDHYVEVPFDLSNVLFVCTANSLHDIPGPLRDRMEVIELGSYTSTEKEEIATKYLFPKAIAKNGIKKENIELKDGAITKLVADYSIEAGVRGLERRVMKICRKIAMKVVKDGIEKVIVSPENLVEFLGAGYGESEMMREKPEVGTISGMSYSSIGGSVLTIETSKYFGKGEINLTGSLGSVMKESASVAYSAVKRILEKEDYDMKKLDKLNFHIHVPEGAVKKEGPSAGVAIALSIYSALTKKQINNDLAVTGEITTRGNVLAIGGLKEKLFAAMRAGIKNVIIPKQNKKSLYDLPKEITEGLKINLVDDLEDAIKLAIVN